MGKVKEPAAKAGGQKTLDNFFKKSSEVKKSSELFTEQGKDKFSSVKLKDRSKDSCIIIDGEEDNKDFKPQKSARNTAAQKEAPSNDAQNSEMILEGCRKVTCIPETQATLTTPSKQNTNSENADDENIDLGLIPDTPQDKNDLLRPKKPLGRSFLLSAVQMTTNPIQQAKENRKAKLELKRKQASLARKAVVSVSVQFSEGNKKTDDSICTRNDSDITQTDGVNGHSEVSLIDAGNVSVVDPTLGNTPTKFYNDTGSMKRMAKQGTSPDSKRISDPKTCEFNNANSFNCDKLSSNNSTDVKTLSHSGVKQQLFVEQTCSDANKTVPAGASVTELNVLSKQNTQKSVHKSAMERKKEKLRRKSLELKMAAKEEKKRQNEKLLQYQLTGTSDDMMSSERVVSVAGDDALGDILQELNSPVHSGTRPSSAPGSGLNSAQGSCPTPPSFTRTKPHKTPASKNSSPGAVGRDMPDCSALVEEWTAEDDAFFSNLGVSTETKGHVSKSSDKGTERPMLDATERTVKSTNIVHLKSRQKRNTIENGKTNLAETSKCGEITEIEQFLTQNAETKDTSMKEHAECKIEEFASQWSVGVETREENGMLVFDDQVQTEAPCSQYGRYTVTKVTQNRDKYQTVLELKSAADEESKFCTLHGFWLDTHVEEGDTVHVLGEFVDSHCHMTDTEGLLVVNPDLLLSGTTVVSACFCMRKSILKEKFKGCDSRNVYMLYGSIIHTIFQLVLKKKLIIADDILKEAEIVLRQASNLLEMYANKTTEGKVMDEVRSYVPQMITWVKHNTTFTQKAGGNSSDVMVTKVCDIEENIWSPRFGIKGKIDLTVEARIKGEPGKVTVPLELKTGKTSFSIEHKGQVSLYSMMYGDRREDPRRGLLLYLKEPSMKLIPAEHLHQKGLIQMRNEMAYYISRQVAKSEDDSGIATFTLGRMPEPISNIRACQKCPQLINCAIYQREVEKRPLNGSGMAGLVNETLGHLTTSHMTYFIQWCLMLDLEAQVDQSKRTVADIWCKSSVDREDGGQCLSGMVLTEDVVAEPGTDIVIISFTRKPGHIRSTPLHEIGLCVQDSIVVSRESPAWVAVCTGFVHEISGNMIKLLTDRECVDRLQGLHGAVWRLDKCDNFSTASILYTNVSRLMADDPHSHKLRRLIIERIKPEFTNTLSKGNIEKVKTVFKKLNKPQKTAILKVLMSKDYVLIKGYPGTGKTSTIVALVQVLHTLGLSVLLTSYTHSAVDNILIKLKQEGMDFLRVGRVSKIHPEIKPYTVDRKLAGCTGVNELENMYMKQKIVASSCLGLNHSLFSGRVFDVCIVDEGSQVLQPACLAPLFTAHRFVLVGDPRQLPPVVQSKEARALGMDESLFVHLDGMGATFELNLQYRMNSEIMKLSNQLVYDGSLKCGSPDVASQTLTLPHPHTQEQILSGAPWMARVLDTSLPSSVLFLDTSQIGAAHCKVKGRGFRNETEARLVQQIVAGLTQVGVEPGDIGVIAPYRSQVLLLQGRLGQGHGSEVEVNTVDQYQGRDKHVIIISFVMSCAAGQKEQAGELLKDIRRLNVAVTRARCKLLLLGDATTLRRFEPMRAILEILTNDEQIISVQ
ncbi:DNA replication ATP-dependent helicase/nuclease DNA2-like [Mya arenaria]|uniref:DNA replication ATP-dependent helicase/nuclease DNA2-like n=1 Tax=Mya arenaria TaxID=6604 RepID=UPI0022E75032|nr:DNA replication ATP-dependent helicase/nuclease DNA2-like [Mya arenaria]